MEEDKERKEANKRRLKKTSKKTQPMNKLNCILINTFKHDIDAGNEQLVDIEGDTIPCAPTTQLKKKQKLNFDLLSIHNQKQHFKNDLKMNKGLNNKISNREVTCSDKGKTYSTTNHIADNLKSAHITDQSKIVISYDQIISVYQNIINNAYNSLIGYSFLVIQYEQNLLDIYLNIVHSSCGSLKVDFTINGKLRQKAKKVKNQKNVKKLIIISKYDQTDEKNDKNKLHAIDSMEDTKTNISNPNYKRSNSIFDLTDDKKIKTINNMQKIKENSLESDKFLGHHNLITQNYDQRNLSKVKSDLLKYYYSRKYYKKQVDNKNKLYKKRCSQDAEYNDMGRHVIKHRKSHHSDDETAYCPLNVTNRDKEYIPWHPRANNMHPNIANNHIDITKRFKQNTNNRYLAYNTMRYDKDLHHNNYNKQRIEAKFPIESRIKHKLLENEFYKDHYYKPKRESIVRGRIPNIDPKMAQFMGRIALCNDRNINFQKPIINREIIELNTPRRKPINENNNMNDDLCAAQGLVKLFNDVTFTTVKDKNKD